MEHVASIPSAGSGRMSPEAVALAVLLHALAALALWALAMYRPMLVPPVEGLRPPAEITADKPTQVRPSGEAPKDVAAPAQRSLEDSVPKPAAAVTPHTQPNPSPLVAPRPQAQPPAVARHQDTPTPPSSPFVNPADEHNRATAEQNYLWEVVRKLRGYRYHAQVQMVEGLTVVQIVVARNGQLLDAQVVRSSGQPGMDQGVLAGVRQGSPYTPLPPTISGPSATFRLPLVSVPEQQ